MKVIDSKTARWIFIMVYLFMANPSVIWVVHIYFSWILAQDHDPQNANTGAGAGARAGHQGGKIINVINKTNKSRWIRILSKSSSQKYTCV